MHVCILTPSYSKNESILKNYDDRTLIIQYIVALGHTYEFHEIHKSSTRQQIRALIKSSKFDLFVNFCDGGLEDDTAGVEVIETLEYYNVPFTGADSRFYDPTREEMKLICDVWGVKTPGYLITSDIADVSLAVEILKFPMIVKHFQSYCSIGLTKDSRVENPEQLLMQTTRMLDEFGEVLIEEFIDGREFTVLVAENPKDPLVPIVYNPIEFKFPPEEGPRGFKYFDIKWINFDQMSEFRVTNQTLTEKLKEIAMRVFLGLHGKGYGRCDIRMNSQGELYLLEINPNCGVFYPQEASGSADYILQNHPRGYYDFLDTILHSAFLRVKPKPKWRRLHIKDKGYGLFATQTIQPGELIIQYEEKPHFLISKSYMDKKYTILEKQLFEKYSYPINSEVWTSRSDRPRDWIHINHSCDPNAWLEGLDLVARKLIPQGDEITIEYATFMDEQMASFECHCNSMDCRKMIKGTDFNLSFMETYENHCSQYISAKRQKLYA